MSCGKLARLAARPPGRGTDRGDDRARLRRAAGRGGRLGRRHHPAERGAAGCVRRGELARRRALRVELPARRTCGGIGGTSGDQLGVLDTWQAWVCSRCREPPGGGPPECSGAAPQMQERRAKRKEKVAITITNRGQLAALIRRATGVLVVVAKVSGWFFCCGGRAAHRVVRAAPNSGYGGGLSGGTIRARRPGRGGEPTCSVCDGRATMAARASDRSSSTVRGHATAGTPPRAAPRAARGWRAQSSHQMPQDGPTAGWSLSNDQARCQRSAQ